MSEARAFVRMERNKEPNAFTASDNGLEHAGRTEPGGSERDGGNERIQFRSTAEGKRRAAEAAHVKIS